MLIWSVFLCNFFQSAVWETYWHYIQLYSIPLRITIKRYHFALKSQYIFLFKFNFVCNSIPITLLLLPIYVFILPVGRDEVETWETEYLSVLEIP